jgi:hypothetical protein
MHNPTHAGLSAPLLVWITHVAWVGLVYIKSKDDDGLG